VRGHLSDLHKSLQVWRDSFLHHIRTIWTQKSWCNTLRRVNISGWCTSKVLFLIPIHLSLPGLEFWSCIYYRFQAFAVSIDQVIVFWALTPCRFISWPSKSLIVVDKYFHIEQLNSLLLLAYTLQNLNGCILLYTAQKVLLFYLTTEGRKYR
jgi:hypothetical protein